MNPSQKHPEIKGLRDKRHLILHFGDKKMVIDNEKTYKKIVYTKGFDIYRDHEMVPIEGVAEALGIDLAPNGRGSFKIKCPCPDHDDKNPSTDLTLSGKYENTFKCWSCNEHGGPLELVMAVNSGITPSEYWKAIKNKNDNKEEYKRVIRARNDAARFIDNIYPGLIEYIDVDKNGKEIEVNKEELKRPDLPFKVWDELKDYLNIDRSVGLKKRIIIKDPPKKDVDEEYMVLKEIDALDDYTYAQIIYDKLNEVQGCLREYKQQIFRDFPELDGYAKAVIISGIKKRTDLIEDSIRTMRDYLVAVQDRDYPVDEDIFDFDDEEFDDIEKE